MQKEAMKDADKSAAETGQMDATDLRFSDSVRVTMDGDLIIIHNAVTGKSKAFPKDAEPILNQFIGWTSLTDLVQKILNMDLGETLIDRVTQTIYDLLQLEVLSTRQNEWSGVRLTPPGAGWSAAMHFIFATRTKRDTIFAIPEEFYEALAQKAVVYHQPSAFYERLGAPFHKLSDPRSDKTGTSVPFVRVMLKRRTSRRFSDHPISETELSKLLYYGWGVTDSVPNLLGDVFIRKTSPSGGSLHPIEVYPIILNVDGLPSGCYHYSVRRHGLEELSREDPSAWIIEACGDQEWVAEAGVIFLCTAFLPRTAWKYDFSRVLRAVISEIGYSGQSAFLTATWLGLGAFTTAALRDEIFEEKLGLDPMREPVFSVTGAGHLEPELKNHSRPRKESATGVEGA